MKRRFFNWLQRVLSKKEKQQPKEQVTVRATLSTTPVERNTTRIPEPTEKKNVSFLDTVLPGLCEIIANKKTEEAESPIPIPDSMEIASSPVRVVDISGLSEKEKWMYKYIVEKGGFVSPTEVSTKYGEFKRGQPYGTSMSCPVLQKLFGMDLLCKNDKGHYIAYINLL